MECAEKSEFGLFGALFFAGFSLGSLFIPRLSDKFGRKPLIFLGLSMHLITGVKIMTETDKNMAYMLLFFQGLGSAGTWFVSYVWMSECGSI